MIGRCASGLRMIAVAAFAALASSPTLPVEPQGLETKQVSLGPDVALRLSQMSTGAEQSVFLTGPSAQARNSRIPLVAGRTRLPPQFAPIAHTDAAFGTALKCLTQAIYYEAANDPRVGKQAVAQVVLNRLSHPAYPNSVCGVVYQGANQPICQFSFTCDGALLRDPLRDQWLESQSVAREALSGNQLSSVGTATHYHANYVVPKWAYTLTKLEVIGSHIFYRFPGAPGEPSAFSASWAKGETIPAINWARFGATANDAGQPQIAPEDTWVPGLTVTPDETDRHTQNDVGGRLDTTKTWRLSIPDPVNAQESYRTAVDVQTASTTAASEDTP